MERYPKENMKQNQLVPVFQKSKLKTSTRRAATDADCKKAYEAIKYCCFKDKLTAFASLLFLVGVQKVYIQTVLE